MDTGGNRGVMDHLKVTGMLEEVSRGNDQLGKERRQGKVFQVSPSVTLLTWHVINHAVLRCHVYIRGLSGSHVYVGQIGLSSQPSTCCDSV